MSIGARNPRAFALDDETRHRSRGVHRVIDEIGQLFLEPRRLVLPDRRRDPLARIEAQPRVQEITLPDRLDDGGRGACEIQNNIPGRSKPAHHPCCGKIFYEGWRAGRKTVNDGLMTGAFVNRKAGQA
jgi:hypothetical protein